MRMSEADLLPLERALADDRAGAWREIACELHYEGEELPIFVLVDDPAAIPAAFARIVALARPWIERFDETEPSISYAQIVGEELRTWDYSDAEEVRSGRFARPVSTRFVASDAADSLFAAGRTESPPHR